MLLLFIAATVLNGAVFLLYDVMGEPFLYAEVLLAAAVLAVLGIDFAAGLRSAAGRERCLHNLPGSIPELPEPRSLAEEDYAEMLGILARETERLQREFQTKMQDTDDYYTAWVHQIKTPIAVMKLHLTQDTEESRALSAELFRIEQYVEMVLSYIRLESSSNDLVIGEYALDDIIRETLRKYAPQFILRRLKLVYEPAGQTVVTDRKWLAFIVDQLVSNALKYTAHGEIRITAKDSMIRISDTGIGIAPEDLPRIFEKGYTGVNGRADRRSTGLGLFLCKKAADLLAASVTCESEPGKGSSFYLTLPEENGS